MKNTKINQGPTQALEPNKKIEKPHHFQSAKGDHLNWKAKLREKILQKSLEASAKLATFQIPKSMRDELAKCVSDERAYLAIDKMEKFLKAKEESKATFIEKQEKAILGYYQKVLDAVQISDQDLLDFRRSQVDLLSECSNDSEEGPDKNHEVGDKADATGSQAGHEASALESSESKSRDFGIHQSDSSNPAGQTWAEESTKASDKKASLKGNSSDSCNKDVPDSRGNSSSDAESDKKSIKDNGNTEPGASKVVLKASAPLEGCVDEAAEDATLRREKEAPNVRVTCESVDNESFESQRMDAINPNSEDPSKEKRTNADDLSEISGEKIPDKEKSSGLIGEKFSEFAANSSPKASPVGEICENGGPEMEENSPESDFCGTVEAILKAN